MKLIFVSVVSYVEFTINVLHLEYERVELLEEEPVNLDLVLCDRLTINLDKVNQQIEDLRGIFLIFLKNLYVLTDDEPELLISYFL